MRPLVVPLLACLLVESAPAGRPPAEPTQRPTPTDQCHRGLFHPSPNYYFKMFFECRHTSVQSDLITAEPPSLHTGGLHCGEITPISVPAWLMATLINAEGVCPSGGACGGGQLQPPEPPEPPITFTHTCRRCAYLHPLACTYVSCHKGLFYVGLCSFGCRRRYGDVSRGKRDKWHLGVALRSGASHGLLHTLVDPSYRLGASGPSVSFRIRSVWPQPLLRRENHHPSNVFFFVFSPCQRSLVHTKLTALFCTNGKVIGVD